MKHVLILIFVLFYISPVFSEQKDSVKLQHDWRQEIGNGSVTFISNYSAPVPFSLTGEPEAVLTMSSARISNNIPLSKIIETEIKEIRKETKFGEFIDNDGRKPIDGIVSYVEEINGCKVAFIHYRAVEIKGEPPIMPRNIKHAIFIKDGKVFYFHLIVLYSGHQDEVRADQIAMIKTIINQSNNK
jgi:hypothetical protein